MCRSIPERESFCAFLEYLKLTPSKSTEPSATSVTGLAGLCREGSSLKTSEMRFMASQDMVIMT